MEAKIVQVGYGSLGMVTIALSHLFFVAAYDKVVFPLVVHPFSPTQPRTTSLIARSHPRWYFAERSGVIATVQELFKHCTCHDIYSASRVGRYPPL